MSSSYKDRHDEYYVKAVESLKKGDKQRAAAYARSAIQMATLMYNLAGVSYEKCQAEYLLETIEGENPPPVMKTARLKETPPVFITKWGQRGSGNGQFSFPRGICSNPAGNIYVVDSGNNRIQKFTGHGRFLLKWGTKGQANGQFERFDPANQGLAIVFPGAGHAECAFILVNRADAGVLFDVPLETIET